MKPTEQSRRTVVKGVIARAEKRGDPFYPKGAFENGEEPEEVWTVTLSIQEGMRPPTSAHSLFRSEKEALEFVRRYPVGSPFPCLYPFEEEIRNDTEKFDQWLESGFFPIRAGSNDLYLPWQVLADADISRNVLENLGQDRVQYLKEKYEDNWTAVAEFEYCYRSLPHSSPAFLAAACNLCFFVLEDDFKAGYLLRDLEVVVHGVEAAATKASETRKKAGEGGSAKSREARQKRRIDLMDKMGEIADRNPDIAKLGEHAIAALATTRCIDGNPALWHQGKGQVEQYLGEIRRGEAGPDLQARYLALFSGKPPKRFA